VRKPILLPITLLLAVGALGACGSSDDAGSDAATSDESSPAESSPAADDMTEAADLSTAETSLGTIVVDGKGMTAYYFTKDAKDSGVSACTGDCATAWPAIESTSDTPTVDGVTGTVGTIPAADGGKQITINGMPIYTFAKDMAAGDVNGQDANGVWYVIAPDGTMIED